MRRYWDCYAAAVLACFVIGETRALAVDSDDTFSGWSRMRLRVAKKALGGPRKCPLRNPRVSLLLMFFGWLFGHLALGLWSLDLRRRSRANHVQ